MNSAECKHGRRNRTQIAHRTRAACETQAAPLLKAHQLTRPSTRRLYDIYFDTPELELIQTGMALRLRHSGRQWLQTLKGGGSVQGGLHQRNEWEIPPHFADIFEHLYGIADPRLMEILEHLTPAQALALLVLTEIERGDAEGARSAYAAMRLFESPAPNMAHVRATLTSPGGHAHEARLRHAHRPALWRAVVSLAVQTGRWDTKAVLESIRQVAHTQARPAGLADGPDMQRILDMLRELGVTFLRVEGDRLVYAVRGKEWEPVLCKQLAGL